MFKERMVGTLGRCVWCTPVCRRFDPCSHSRWCVTLQLCSTPLHVATRTGHADIVEYLLSCDVKINYKDRVGSAPCSSFWPFDFSCPECVSCSQEGDTALHDAVRLNRYKIVKLLVMAGADANIKNHVSFFFSPMTAHVQSASIQHNSFCVLILTDS